MNIVACKPLNSFPSGTLLVPPSALVSIPKTSKLWPGNWGNQHHHPPGYWQSLFCLHLTRSSSPKLRELSGLFLLEFSPSLRVIYDDIFALTRSKIRQTLKRPLHFSRYYLSVSSCLSRFLFFINSFSWTSVQTRRKSVLAYFAPVSLSKWGSSWPLFLGNQLLFQVWAKTSIK